MSELLGEWYWAEDGPSQGGKAVLPTVPLSMVRFLGSDSPIGMVLRALNDPQAAKSLTDVSRQARMDARVALECLDRLRFARLVMRSCKDGTEFFQLTSAGADLLRSA